MKERLSSLLEMFPPGMLLKLSIASAVVFVGTLIAIPIILVRLPEDYFDVRIRRTWMKDRHPALRIVGRVVKNIAGLSFLLAGIAMLVLPGQGVLTILIGISLLDFPGKQRLEARIIGQRTVLHAVNSLRARFGKPPLVLG
jgi:Putative transmembrane protein (PGPGW)